TTRVSSQLVTGCSRLLQQSLGRRYFMKPGRSAQSGPLRYPTQSAPRREHELQRSEPPRGSVPALQDRTRGRIYPKSPAGAAAFRASMPATLDTRLHWSDNRRTNRFEFAPELAGSERQIHRSRDQDHSVPRSDRSPHGVSALSAAITDLCEARFRSPRDRPKRRAAFSNLRRGLRYAPQRLEL